jgi:hypothetical protein
MLKLYDGRTGSSSAYVWVCFGFKPCTLQNQTDRNEMAPYATSQLISPFFSRQESTLRRAERCTHLLLQTLFWFRLPAHGLLFRNSLFCTCVTWDLDSSTILVRNNISLNAAPF